MRLLIYVWLLPAAWLVSCATPSKPAGKPHDFCICGPTLDAEGKPSCAIWGEGRPTPAVKTFASSPGDSCEPADCSKLFSKFCRKIQMSALARPKLPPVTPPCYCDALLLENDKGQTSYHCAAWAEDGKNLIEYYALEDCSPTRCGEPPFTLAPKVCKNSFKPFYPPLLNQR